MNTNEFSNCKGDFEMSMDKLEYTIWKLQICLHNIGYSLSFKFENKIDRITNISLIVNRAMRGV